MDRSLAGYSPWGHKELDTTEGPTLTINKKLLRPFTFFLHQVFGIWSVFYTNNLLSPDSPQPNSQLCLAAPGLGSAAVDSPGASGLGGGGGGSGGQALLPALCWVSLPGGALTDSMLLALDNLTPVIHQLPNNQGI